MALVGDHGGSYTCPVTAEGPCPPRRHHRLTLPLAIWLIWPAGPLKTRRACWRCWPGSPIRKSSHREDGGRRLNVDPALSRRDHGPRFSAPVGAVLRPRERSGLRGTQVRASLSCPHAATAQPRQHRRAGCCLSSAWRGRWHRIGPPGQRHQGRPPVPGAPAGPSAPARPRARRPGTQPGPLPSQGCR